MIARDTPSGRILIADAQHQTAEWMADALARAGYDVEVVDRLQSTVQVLQGGRIDVTLIDEDLFLSGDLREFESLVRKTPGIAVIVTSSQPDVTRAVEAIKLGATDYLVKPSNEALLVDLVRRAIASEALQSDTTVGVLPDTSTAWEGVIGTDVRMRKVFELLESVAPTNATVLFRGPSGTGKSLIASALHHRSRRRGKPFVEVSCGALSDTLLESEMFGHVRGAFTGASASRIGKFEAADTGTIFLDEIAAASPAMQRKLLRVLQSNQFEPVGSVKTRKVDVRVMLATNVDLEMEVADGRFREDLFYRINVVSIDLPALRDRPCDIPLLARHFVKRSALAHDLPERPIDPDAMQMLMDYEWPGNVRELENAIDRAVILCKGRRISVADFAERIRLNRSTLHRTDLEQPLRLKDALAEPERKILESALRANGWNRESTAAQLGINRTTLYKKMKRLGLDRGPAGDPRRN